METLSSTPQTETENFNSSSGKEKLLEHIASCNGQGMSIEGLMSLILKGDISVEDYTSLNAQRRIQIDTFHGKMVWVIAGHETTDRI